MRFRRVVTVVLIDIYGLLGLKVFGNSVYFFLGFGRERRRGWGFVDRYWGRFGSILLRIAVGSGDTWREFQQNLFLSVLVCDQ